MAKQVKKAQEPVEEDVLLTVWNEALAFVDRTIVRHIPKELL